VDAVISQDELQLAARNHGMPLEALRYPITPAGLHYLLIHYDIPDVDAGRWALSVEGRVARPLTLTLADLRERPAHEVTSTMECAGNGRALLAPHIVSQPWLLEAVGNAAWKGVPLRAILEEAEPLDDAVEVVLTGLDRGFEKGVEQS
jgi:DMSO/TMAO reductase YedYZ molybdopterin-dependent catalytic subunit